MSKTDTEKTVSTPVRAPKAETNGSRMSRLDSALTRMSETVKDQLRDALAAFRDRDPASADQVVERDDVVDNHYAYLEELIFEVISDARTNVAEARRWRGALRVLGSLEHIGDAACHIAKHAIMLATEPSPSAGFDLSDFGELAVTAADDGVRAFLTQDLDAAKLACERERELDEIYVKKLRQVMQLLKPAEDDDIRYLMHVLAAMKYLERVGDFVLNIGEAAFFATTGTRLKYPQFKQLETLLAEAHSNGTKVYRHFWDGISGAVVLEVDSSDGARFLFKEGGRKKIDDEIERVIEWERLAPHHVPRLIGRAQDKDRRAVLREFAAGSLLQDVLLAPDNNELKFAAIEAFAEAVIDIWSSTLVARSPQLDYAQQIRSRLREVLRRHPDLEELAKEELAKFGGIYGMLDRLQKREGLLAPPFSVWSHGDLNANNVVYDAGNRQIVFIDVHRSRYGDYAGDVGVFLTSTLRTFPKKKVARTLSVIHESFLQRVRAFAESNHDRTFLDRLRLARARALITSARLTEDEDRAEFLFGEGLSQLKKVGRRLQL
jgi:phosphate uptake regulator/aminoglycoside phosphotransferase (APT) family kinase protein